MSRKHPGSRFHHAIQARRWSRVRRAVFDRDGHRCTGCGRPGRLEAHHVTQLQHGGDPFDLQNIKTYCRTCHVAAHKRPVSDAEQAWARYVSELVS